MRMSSRISLIAGLLVAASAAHAQAPVAKSAAPALDDATIFRKDNNLIHFAKSRKAMSDANDRFVFLETFDGGLNFHFGVRVERGSGFVEN